MRHPSFTAFVIALAGVVIGVLATGQSAWAGPFGGFSADETRYLVGRDTVCTPIAINRESGVGKAQGVPRCEAADTSAVAAMKFRRGALQQGRDARFAASARTRTLTIRGLGGADTGDIASWSSADAIARVVSVYASPNQRLVAVEYEVRFAGRLRVDVVGFALPGADGIDQAGIDRAGIDRAGAEPPGREPGVGPGAPLGREPGVNPGANNNTADPSNAVPELASAARSALQKARKLAKNNRHAAAARAYGQVLGADPDHAEARFGLARALAGQRKLDDAVRELEALADSRRSDAIKWRVEARFDKAFAKLRADVRFRKATGLERAPGQTPSLYERVLGFSNQWEQPETTCEKPEVALDMVRLQQTFKLRITSRCGGYTDALKLRGTWRLIGADQVELVLPNTRSKDENLMCTMRTCDDEDCLACVVDVDLDFVLRPVRR